MVREAKMVASHDARWSSSASSEATEELYISEYRMAEGLVYGIEIKYFHSDG